MSTERVFQMVQAVTVKLQELKLVQTVPDMKDSK